MKILSTYDFFAFLKKHHAFTAYVSGYDADNPGRSMQKFLNNTARESWMSAAFHWSKIPLYKPFTMGTNRSAWANLSSLWEEETLKYSKEKEEDDIEI